MTNPKTIAQTGIPRHRSVGSQWGKWDLHFHTPSSFDYADKSVSDEQIVETLIKAGLDLIVITDHHFVDVNRIKHLQQLAGDRLSVLPGIEFRSDLGGKDKVHLIGVFPEDCNLDDVWTKIRGKLDLTTEDIQKKGGDEKIYVVFRDACDVIHEVGGIVSVHAGTKTNTIESIGNNEVFKQSLKTDLVRDFIDLYEVGKASDVEDYASIVFPAIRKEIPLIICCDNHDIKAYAPKPHAGLREIHALPHSSSSRAILIEPLLQASRMPRHIMLIEMPRMRIPSSLLSLLRRPSSPRHFSEKTKADESTVTYRASLPATSFR